MSQALESQVLKVARARRRVRWLVGGATCLTGLLGAAVCIGSLDYLIHFRDPGLRLLGTALVLGTAGWIARRSLWPLVAEPVNTLATARSIEHQFPELGDALASSIEFLSQPADDPRAGSLSLRRSVVVRTASRMESFDWKAAIDRGPARRAFRLAAALLLAVVLLVVLDVEGAWRAARRLAQPWEPLPWPQTCLLRFVDLPERVALGSEVELTVANEQGPLPDRVQLQIRWQGKESDRERIESIEMSRQGPLAIHRLAKVTSPFAVRVSGGDDDSDAWHSIQVVPPPRLEFAELSIFPPPYTGWAPAQSRGPNVRLLAGSRLVARGAASEPLHSARLRVTAIVPNLAPNQSDKSVSDELPLDLNPERLRFSSSGDAGYSWSVMRSFDLSWELLSLRGVAGHSESDWSIRAIADQPPAVSIVSTAIPTELTTAALIPLRIAVKDDLAIRDVRVELYAADGSADAQRSSPESAEPRTASGQNDSIASSDAEMIRVDPVFESAPIAPDSREAWGESDNRVFDFELDLGHVSGLRPGMAIDLVVTASDFLPQTGRTSRRRLTLVGLDQLRDRLGKEYARILVQLAETLQAQTECRTRTRAIELGLGSSGESWRTRRERLEVAELNQRQVARALGTELPGVTAQLDRVLDELRLNRLDGGDESRRLTDIRNEVNRIRSEPVAIAESGLSAALRVIKAASGRDAVESELADAARDEVAESVTQALSGQDRAIELLESLLRRFQEWDSFQRFARDIEKLYRDQSDLRDRTGQQLAELLAASGEPAAENATLERRRIAERQNELARVLQGMQSRMSEMSRQLRDLDRRAAERLDAAHVEAQRSGLIGQMRVAAESIAQARWGTAQEEQSTVLSGLDRVMQLLLDRPVAMGPVRAQELAGASSELNELAQRQRELLEDISRLPAEPGSAANSARRELERLAREEQRLAARIATLRDELGRLGEEAAADNLAQADESARAAATAARRGDRAAAQTGASDSAGQLDAARRQLAGKLADARNELANGQLALIERLVRDAARRERAVLAPLSEIVKESPPATDDDRSQPVAARREQIRATQLALAGEFERIIPNIDGQPAFALAFESLASASNRLAESVMRPDQDTQSLTAANHIVRQLEALLDALASPRAAAAPDVPPGSTTGEQGQGGAGGEPPANGLDVAQLKVVHWLQQSLRDRTAELETWRQKYGDWSPDQRDEIARMATEQLRIAELLDRLRDDPQGNQE